MNQSRQQAFQRLRPPCVELSSVALKFKADQASPKAILLALEPVRQTLQSLGDENLLDEKLAEYAFFPLTHIFNQSRRLSSHIIEVTIRCVEVLVSKGWRDKLLPEMARQLLILMGLLVSQNPNQRDEPPTDELIVAAFECISVLTRQISRLGAGILDEVGDKNIVDQLVYQLLEAITNTTAENVQVSATYALLELYHAVESPVLLASLLPRTVSTLVKVLRPNTQARRTRKVLVSYLELLTVALKRVLTDNVVSQILVHESDTKPSKADDLDQAAKLDQSWLDATTPQIDLALVQVVKIRAQQGSDVAQALLKLCLLILEDCSRTLARSVPLMVETLVILCRRSDSSEANAALRHLVISQPEIANILRGKFSDWSRVLPRVMQGNDDKPKQQMLGQLAISYSVLTDALIPADELSSTVASVLVDSVSASVETNSARSKLIDEAPQIHPTDLVRQSSEVARNFKPIILDHPSQQSSLKELTSFLASIKSRAYSPNITRSIVNHIRDPDISRRISATWLALNLLRSDSDDAFDVADWVDDPSSALDLSTSRPFLISDLYSLTLQHLLQHAESTVKSDSDPRLVALSLECLVLQASQLGESYRPELVETLFPLLTFLGDNDARLQIHAMAALNLLATACEYSSAAQMLVENADYLVNAIALRLNAFDVSRDGLQVLAMMIRLGGSRLLPHLDDLIGSIFASLDNFHGYSHLVEKLFDILKMVVEESSRNPTVLGIQPSQERDRHQHGVPHASGLDDILDDLQARKDRKRKSHSDHREFTTAPHRPWTSSADDQEAKTPRAVADKAQKEEGDDTLEPSSRDKEAGVPKSYKLLLNIAESAVPHMSSPSPKVRLILLELLQKICPVLAQDENSFLPLVNSVWPALVPRLLGKRDDGSTDMPYTVQAAAETMSILCWAAGDFMTSRVENLFPDLEAMFKRYYLAIAQSRKQSLPSRMLNGTSTSLGYLTHQQIIQEPPEVGGGSRVMRNSDTQILESLIALLITIVESVRISEDNADKVFDMLDPIMHMPGQERVKMALQKYNEDAAWLTGQCPEGRDFVDSIRRTGSVP
ncbi:uncharacterized protein Z518_07307 [Rhinocladiella mackenziei CBS 650.93]|uniref:HEAT repeat protein n=1 Tax=Rhinocladiella mackenziei CBS 650.93 TaxID=1442369 RepID=A0A0D2ID34_9EURO|nr:uncharacterized protein Z518_07307 [Rhinocladiella mackenziei CBS 650.93]KIX03754.1 hypothetical protein Z518_07307 [Rhinocladiella mackenziei CBS 650.93]